MKGEAQNDTVTEETEIESSSSTIKNKVAKGVVLLGKYELHSLLGIGASAKVYHATNLHTGQSMAVKVVSKHKVLKTGLATNIEREISVMRRLQHHPHIVNLFEVFATKTKIYFVMEFVPGGDLFQEISVEGHLSEDLCRKYFRQLISGIRHCHSHGVFHRDLKLDNLLNDENKDLKLLDFGLSAVKEQIRLDGLLQTVCGTPAYVAPEILAKRGYEGAKVDVWSCGVVLFALRASYLPFNDYKITVLYRKIYRGQFRFPKWMSPELRNHLSQMLDTNLQARITIDEILRHTWFKMGGYWPEFEPKPMILTKHEWDWARSGVKSLNAFNLISFSTGLDMSGLVANSDVLDHVERMISKAASERILEKLEEVAKGTRAIVTSKENISGAKFEGQDGNFVALVEFYRLTEELVVVEIKIKEKRQGSGVQFCKDMRSQIVKLTS